LASSLVRELAQDPVEIRRFFRAARTPPPPPSGRAVVKDVQGDVAVRAELAAALKGVNVVHHLAAQTSVYVADSDPVADLGANVVPMLELLEAARASGTRPLVLFASSVTVYGMPDRLPVDESFADDPRTIYEVHKLHAEQYLAHYVKKGIVRGATLRLANVYGPGPLSSRPDRGVLNAMVRRALAGERLNIYGAGNFLRDYVYVDDVARAFALAARHPEAVNGRAFVIASGQGTTVADAVRLVAELVGERTGRRVEVGHVAPPANLSAIELRQFVGRADAFREATGWTPALTLREGIKRTIEEFLDPEHSR
jgi:nucleoside-diphosphate-sugar epimerase